MGRDLGADEMLRYIVGVTAHRGFTARFQDELRTPGVRVPLTSDADLFDQAVTLGTVAIACHTTLLPASQDGVDPVLRHEIGTGAEEMPEAIVYELDAREIRIGTGAIGPVSRDAWEYDVNGMKVLRKWFGYRRRNPTGRRTSPLDDIHITHWTDELTEELLTLISCLERLVALEPEQAALLEEIMGGDQITVDDLEAACILPVPDEVRRPMLDTPVAAGDAA